MRAIPGRIALPVAAALLATAVLGAGPAARPGEQAAPAVDAGRFSLRVNPWLNLHHFVYQWARIDAERSPHDTRPLVEMVERAEWKEISPEAGSGFSAAARLYRDELVARSLTFDDGLVAIRNALTEARGWGSGAPEGLPPEVASALAGAAPLYRQRWWKPQERDDRAWIEAVIPLVEKYGGRLEREIALAYGGSWPEERVPVEVSAYANWAGAYTTNDPMLITISSRDPDIQGSGALELLYHEASHVDPLESALRRDLDAAFRRAGGEAPPRLWHRVIFHTAGTLTCAVVAGDGIACRPYALRAGLTERSEVAKRTWAALDRYWKPFLEGRTDRVTALDGLAKAVLAIDDPAPAPGS